MSPTGTNESGASGPRAPVQRGLPPARAPAVRHRRCRRGRHRVAGGVFAEQPGQRGRRRQVGGNKEFHGAYPYQLPPKGHFNLAAGVTDGIQQQSPYLDLIYPSGGMYYWADKKWEYMMAESSTLDDGGQHLHDEAPVRPDLERRLAGHRQGRRGDVQPALADAPAVVDVPVRRQGPGRHHGRCSPSARRRRCSSATSSGHRSCPDSVYGEWATKAETHAQGQDQPGQRRGQDS